MKPIQSLEIKGYRGIEKFNLEPKKINIFVGRNNTGKSSVLEATTLVATSSKGYVDALGKDILENFVKRKKWNLGYFIKIGHEGCRIRATMPPNKIDVTMKYVEEGLPEELVEKAKPLLERYVELHASSRVHQYFRDPYFRERKERPDIFDRDRYTQLRETAYRELIKQPKLFISTSLTGDVSIALHSEKEILPSRGTPSNIVFVGTDYGISLKDLHDALLPTSKFSLIMDSVRKDLEYLADVRTLEEEIFVYLRGVDRPVPLSLMGEGFIEVLRIAFVSALARGGIAVLEEPENHLHPGFMELTSRYLAKAAQKDKIQLFISTHSLEFLKYILKEAKEDTCIIRMHGEGSPVDYEVMDGEEALQESEDMGLDLRGI